MTMEQMWLEEMADDYIDVVTLSLLEDDELKDQPGKHGGSLPGQSGNIERGRVIASKQLYLDYFCANSVYNCEQFCRRFREARAVFNRVVQALEGHDPYFTQRKDCAGRLGFTSLQKCTAAMRMLAYGHAANCIDEYVRMGESTVLESLEHFCEGVVACFGEEYCRVPTHQDLKEMLARSAKRSLPGMIGSIDCSKWFWKNCPTALHGQYCGSMGYLAISSVYSTADLPHMRTALASYEVKTNC